MRGQRCIGAGTRGLLSGEGGSVLGRCSAPWPRHSGGCRLRGPAQGPNPRASSDARGGAAHGSPGVAVAVAVAAAALAREREEEAIRVQTRGLSQAVSSSGGSCRSTSSSTETRTRPAPAASARPSAPPRGSYRPQCAGPAARVLPLAAKECLTPGNPAVPPPRRLTAGALPRALPGLTLVPARLRVAGRIVPSENGDPVPTLALIPESGQSGQTQPATPGRHFSPFLRRGRQ